MKKKKILIIGAGSGGLLTLGQMLSGLDSNWEVHSVYDPKIPILGVGESSGTNMPLHLFRGTDFVLERDAHYLDATPKFSVRYTNWRKHTFSSYLVTPSYGLHIDNTRLKEFVFMRLNQNYPDRFKIIEGNVLYMKNIQNGVEVSINDQISTYDYVIDCGGFPKDYKGYIGVDLPINHALVTRIEKPGDWNYTHHWAHKNGWMFGIPLQSKQGWGYLYNDEITSKEDAMEDMCEILKLDPQSQSFKEYSFQPYYALGNLIDGRILKNGNRYMFFEPMEAMSMEFYVKMNVQYLGLIKGDLTKDKLIGEAKFDIESLIMFYRFIYHGGSIYDTEFWRTTKEKTSYYIQNMPQFGNMMSYFNDNKHKLMHSTDMLLTPYMLWHWKGFDKELGYNYFKNCPQ